jgi:N-succinyldiaminopimelate aminotransferase
MPRAPRFNPSAEAMPGSVYAPVPGSPTRASGVAGEIGDVCPLNVGDTWLEPFEGGRLEDIRGADHPGLNRYSPTQGIPPLLEAIVEKVRERNGLSCERDGVLVSAGATPGLAAAVGALAAPGEEVLILAPFWPLIRGMVQAFAARPVEVPFYDRIHSLDDAVAAVRERISERSAILYVSTPSNPTGRVLPEAWLAALAELAREHDLWIFSDEVYERIVYRGCHVSMARFAPERTLTFFSFSKSYGMAGYRVGYLVGPPEAVGQVHKLGAHTYYAAPTPSQRAGLYALRDGDAWVERAKASYQEVADATAAALGLSAPEGSTFLFLDVRSRLDERGIQGFLADCVADGFALSPGASCGAEYEGFVRLCYTAAPPERVAAAVDALARRLR